jgi:cytochrome P450
MRPMIARLADELLDRMEASGDLDIVHGFSRELPLRVISEMLGLPAELREKVTGWMAEFSDIKGIVSASRAFGVIGKVMKLLRDEFEQCRINPRDGLVSELVLAEADGERLSEDELLAMVLVLFVAGHETTTHLISTSLLSLTQHPDQLAGLRADPGLMANAVEELHRWNSPVQATKPRMAREDMEFYGVRLKRGDRVMGLLGAANCDPDHFENPDMLDLKRVGVRHAGYGGGMHLCLGMHLARVETEVAFERIIARWPAFDIAIPFESVRWSPRPGMRGPVSLPLLIGEARPRARAA